MNRSLDLNCSEGVRQMRILSFLAFFSVCVLYLSPAEADMSITAYQKNMKSPSKRDMTYFYLEAVGTGITWTNSIHVKRTGATLFCMPKRTPLTGELAAKLLDWGLSLPESRTIKKDDSVSMILVASLMRKFPCQ